MEEECKPCLLILSATNTKPKSLIKLITKSAEINQQPTGILEYKWSIDTKYYTADILILGAETDFERSEYFNENVEGLIIHLDTNKETGLKDLEVWKDVQNDCDPEVKILIANYCDDKTKISRNDAIQWCLKRNFEFIELYPSSAHDSDEDNQEKVGAERIIEAIHSHTWSNLKLKKQQKKNSEVPNMPRPEDDCEEDSLDDFSELFSQLHTMRQSLNSLPVNERKHCAEQMVTAFWKAIGGDEEEITDL